jgi:hypothetical protein
VAKAWEVVTFFAAESGDPSFRVWSPVHRDVLDDGRDYQIEWVD